MSCAFAPLSRSACIKGNLRLSSSFTEGDIYAAAWLLLFDSWLWMAEVYNSPEDSLFRRLADLTRDIDQPPLRFTHCIRDLAYGDESRGDDLVAMVRSEDPAYRCMFEECLWRLTPEEEQRQAAEQTKRTETPKE